jgi:UDP-hydrolysing UDP-N-acetyl-D-glucosamine 2-epimerase
MIGDGWDGAPATRPQTAEDGEERRLRIAVVTGSRADFGLLAPVMRAIQARSELDLLVIAAGSHLVSPALTYRDVKQAFAIADAVPMQDAGKHTRADEVQATGKGVSRLGRAFTRLEPDWVVVLGDRIEAFAAASTASIGGYALAHIHGGDRAEGIADEAMRHAITKLAHLHLAATPESADRIRRMGERPEHVHIVGSPAIDGLAEIAQISAADHDKLGSPELLFLMHPIGRPAEHEESVAAEMLAAIQAWRPSIRILALHPNFDAGREGTLRALQHAAGEHPDRIHLAPHLPRERFVGVLKRLAASGGLLVGNSSAALIEAAALKLPAVDIGPRQAGRERAGNVVACGESADAIRAALNAAASIDRSTITHPYGDGSSGQRTADLLSQTNPHDPRLLRKRIAF